MEKKIVEGNKIIAEFMGEDVMCEHESFGKTYQSMMPVKNIKDWSKAFLTYHTSWNKLMPVVEKIENEGYRFTISTTFIRINTCKNGNHDDHDEYRILEGKLYTTWYAVLEFINWYNSQPHDNKNEI